MHRKRASLSVVRYFSKIGPELQAVGTSKFTYLTSFRASCNVY